MRWFTAAFHDGRMPDAEQDSVIRDYREHLGDLRRVAPELRDLADLNLHDGQVQRWDLTETEFRWSLLIGDLQSGYQLATVTYRAPSLLGVEPWALTAARLDTSPDVELLSDEVDMRAEGLFEHRFRFWPDLEFGVAFSQVEVALGPGSSGDRRMG